jgi:amidophosphoribosyltransferase
MREMGVRMKLTPLVEHLRGQRVVLVDDSIVRGTTTKQIVKLVFESGAKEVHVRITAPPIEFPCFYGIDMASRSELAAARMNLKELEAYIGCTSLGFLSIDGAVSAVGTRGKENFCLACFNGDYPIPVPENLTKNALDRSPQGGDAAAVASGQLVLLDT